MRRRPGRLRRVLAALGFTSGWPASYLLAFGPALAAPAPGRYDAELCVATRAGVVPTCGAAEADLHAGGRLDVRIADIAYRLALRSTRVDVATMHGRMQIDEFSAPFEWAGDVLTFTDSAKDVRYEVRLAGRRGGH